MDGSGLLIVSHTLYEEGASRHATKERQVMGVLVVLTDQPRSPRLPVSGFGGRVVAAKAGRANGWCCDVHESLAKAGQVRRKMEDGERREEGG